MVLEFSVDNHIATVRLNRPDQMNAQNLEMRQAMVEAWRRIRDDDDIWLGIVTGSGKAFSAGHDLKEKLSAEQKAADPGTAEVYRGLHAITKPMLAAINGHCLAQGAGVALLTDVRVVAEDAQFGWPQVKRGISSVSGPTLVARSLPRTVAFEFLFTGRYFTAEEALHLGLVSYVLPKEQVMDKVRELAEMMLNNAPLSLRAIKEAYIRTQGLSLADAFFHAEAMAQPVKRTRDAEEGLAAFAERRTPVWQGK